MATVLRRALFRQCNTWNRPIQRPTEWRSLPVVARRAFVIPSYAKLVEVTGVIDKSANEGLLYFDNVFPVRYNLWDFRQFLLKNLSRKTDPQILEYIKKTAIPPGLSIELLELIPRPKDGGAIIKYKNTGELSEKEVEQKIQEYASDREITSWFSPFNKMRTFIIKGTPWIEDLHTFPSIRLRVEFDGPDVEQEMLFYLFRRYGLIRDITPLSPASKDLPRYATLQFVRMRGATSARNCLHGVVAPNGTKLHIFYEPTLQKHIFRDWFFNHPRIVLPVLAALVATITVAVFDPIRSWFIKQRITKRFSLSDNAVISYVRDKASYFLNRLIATGSFGRYGQQVAGREADMQIRLADRQGVVTQLKGLLAETPETFIVLHGPRGSGKVDLVRDHVVTAYHNTLSLDCERLAESRSDALFIKELATQTGYFPVFPWMNNISSFVDLIVQGVIGQKAGFSETLDTQVQNVLESAATAIRNIAINANRAAAAAGNGNYAERAYGEIDPFADAPNKRPVVVIEYFLHQADKHDNLYKNIAEWASVLVRAKMAHVIFITSDIGYSKVLQEALPDHVYNSISVGDATPEIARSFVLNQVKDLQNKQQDIDKDVLSGLDEALTPLGGRMTDLVALVRRMAAGESSTHAAREMIQQSVTEIIKRFLRPTDSNKSWTAEQVWVIIKGLAASEDIRYNELMLNPLFKGGSGVISALEHAELITVTEIGGRAYAIKAGRPIYRAAFQHLVDDKGLAAALEISTYTATVGALMQGINKDEEELMKLATLLTVKGMAVDVSDRMKYLAEDIKIRQGKIAGLDSKIEFYKKVLSVEY
ncbi:RNA12 protein-domain-containing protein [Limtongia smithiae]|uniref:RNA12 protein-domain-containing protein n=1 Tax=Limtongia smithiae TaxID=1125753 RepID=UPI0034CF59CC